MSVMYRNAVTIGTAKFQVDVIRRGGGESDINVQWMLRGKQVNMSTAPKCQDKQSNGCENCML